MANATVWTEKTFKDNETVIDAAFLNGFQRNVIAAEGVVNGKVDKVTGKALSTNDFTTALKNKLDALPTKATLDTSLAGKVDKVDGKGLSTNDYTDEDKQKVDVVDTKAPVILETVSGAIASFPDGADNMPIKSLVATIEPVQDLHGYDSPWPAGGGKNLFDIQYFADHYETVGSSKVARLALELEPNTTYTVSANSPISSNASSVYAWAGGIDAASPVTQTNGVGLNNPKSVTTGNDGVLTIGLWNESTSGHYAYTKFLDGTYYAQIELGSTSTNYAPFENICPISGWTGMEGARMWKNLFSIQDFADNYETIGSSTVGRLALTLAPNTTYTVSEDAPSTGSAASVFAWAGGIEAETPTSNSNGVFINQPRSVTTGNDGLLTIGLYLDNASGRYSYTEFLNGTYHVQIELGSTASEFAGYKATISVNWESEAGTVYGGTLDVISGKMVVDRAFIEFDADTDITFNNHGVPGEGENFNYWFSCYFTPSNVTNNYDKWLFSHGMCSNTGWSGVNRAYKASSNNRIYMLFGVNEDVSDTAGVKNFFAAQKTAGTPVQLVYTLASPIDYQLTPQEVTTLLGTNHVWTDVGPVEVTYPADTKLFIEKLTQPTEDDMTADHAIASGTFFQLGNTLYLATAQIAAGATITPGTNATKLSLADALNSLNS